MSRRLLSQLRAITDGQGQALSTPVLESDRCGCRIGREYVEGRGGPQAAVSVECPPQYDIRLLRAPGDVLAEDVGDRAVAAPPAVFHGAGLTVGGQGAGDHGRPVAGRA